MENELNINPPSVFDFPFPPYSIQHDFMNKLFSVLEHKKLGIFESPTGTGKSLSIICGALKWLEDRNQTNKEMLKSEIEILEKKKIELESKTVDWLTSKSEEINVTKQLNSLKLIQKNMLEYYQKFEELKSKKKTFKVKKHSRRVLANESKSVESVNDSSQENMDDIEEDALLDELVPTSNDESLSDEEDQNKNVYEPIKILICSRTHSQLSQLVGEIIKSPFGKKIRAITLASRQNYCINPLVNKLKNGTLINERCLDMQKKEKKSAKYEDEHGKIIKRRKIESCSCPYYKQMAIDELKDQALIEICDVEDLVGLGEQIQGCPYYASRKASEDAEVVLVPYNTLLYKATREANAIKLKNNVVIIDEAHNLLEALAQMYSSEVNLEQLELTLQQLKNYKQRFSSFFSAQNLLCINQLTFVLNKLQSFLAKNLDPKCDNKSRIFTVQDFVIQVGIDNFNIFKLLKFSKESRIGQKIHSYTKKNPQIFEKKEVEKKGLQNFLSDIEKCKDKPVLKTDDNDVIKQKLNFGNPFFVFVQFLECLTYSYEDGRIIMCQSKEKKQCKFNFLLLNPSAQFKDIISEARAVVVAGGTMKPLSEFKDRLFISAGASPDRIVHFTCDHVIPKDNILPLIVTKGRHNENLLFNFENRMSMGNVLKDVFCEICKKVPGGIVVFFPSYKYESWVWEQVKGIPFGRPVFREPQDSGSVDSVLESYASAIKRTGSKGALLFSVVGGKLSEGLNFSDDLGRCVVVVGLPYGNINSPDLKEKMSYLDKNHGSGSGKSFYEALCTKAVNQCIGRAVRHKDDYATMILLDVRYDRPSTKGSLPDWIKRSLKTCDFSQALFLIEKFFEERKKN